MARLWLIALVVLLAGAAPPDGRALLDRARETTGATHWDPITVLFRSYRITLGGIDGHVSVWVDPATGAYSQLSEIGPERVREGWDGSRGWRSDWAGRVTKLDGDELADLRAEALWQSFPWALPDRLSTVHGLDPINENGKAFDRVEISRTGSPVIVLWLDAADGVPARVLVPGDGTRVDLSDWQTEAGGVRLPARIDVSGPRDPEIRHLAAVRSELRAEAEAPFAPPAAPPPDFRFVTGDGRSVSLLLPTGDAFLVDVSIDGHGPYPFALDTGAADTIDSGLATELGLDMTGALSGIGAGEEPVKVGLTHVKSLEIGDLALESQLFRVATLAPADSDYRPPYRGLLGSDLFGRVVVRIDQERREVVLSDPATWPRPTVGQAVSLGFHGRLPTAEGVIDGLTGRFTLDTGQANTLTLYRPFIERTGSTDKWVPRFTAPVGWGLGGGIMAEVARGQGLTLGPVEIDKPILYLSLQKAGAFSDPEVAGNVGQGAFVRFDVTFDYPDRLAWFERIAAYDQGDQLHIMTLKRSFLGYTVLSVLPGGAAAVAGVKAGDEVERIDGSDATRLDAREVNFLFSRRPGTKVTLSLRSHGGLREVVVVLRPAV